jgi:S-(hydroxymethyl)glutathione dehydrogenase/alcohol dehydrogenase
VTVTPKTFRAAVLAELDQPLVIDELETPELRFGQVLVRIRCSGICGAQLNEIGGAKGPDRFLPHLLGHEASAVVVEVGEGVTTVRPGDHVVCHWRKGAGHQAPTATFRSATFGTVNSGWVTTFSEYSVVSENRVTPIPEDFDPEIAALLGCALTTAMGVVNNDAGLGIGESIAVLGAGGVGQTVVHFASLVAAHPIVAVDVHDAKLELARSFGATHVVNGTSTDPLAAIRDAVGPAGADVVVETTGITELIETAYEACAATGRVVLVGVPTKSARKPSFYTLPLHFEKSITGSEGGGTRPDVDIPKLVGLVEADRLAVGGLITRRHPFEAINDAIGEVRSGACPGRCIVWMEDAAPGAA